MQKRIIINILGLALIVSVLSSCAVTQSTKYTSTTVTASSQEIVPTAITQVPKVGSLEVDITRKISGKASGSGQDANLDNLRELAVYEALKANGGDVLVEPVFKVTTTREGTVTTMTVEVKGFAGKYEDVHDLQKADLKLLQNYLAPLKQDSVPVTTTTTTTTTTSNVALTAPAPVYHAPAPSPTPTYSVQDPIPSQPTGKYAGISGKRLLTKGIVQTSLGVAFLAGGAKLVTSAGSFGDGAHIAGLTIGSALVATGVVMLITGPIKIAKGSKRMREEKGGANAFIYPVFEPGINKTTPSNIGMGMTLSF